MGHKPQVLASQARSLCLLIKHKFVMLNNMPCIRLYVSSCIQSKVYFSFDPHLNQEAPATATWYRRPDPNTKPIQALYHKNRTLLARLSRAYNLLGLSSLPFRIPSVSAHHPPAKSQPQRSTLCVSFFEPVIESLQQSLGLALATPSGSPSSSPPDQKQQRIPLAPITSMPQMQFPPRRQRGNDSRLCVAEALRALLESYGGTLNRLSMRYVADSSNARLVALLRRQTFLAQVIIREEEALPALCQAILQGCCPNLEVASFPFHHNTVLEIRLALLAGAFEADQTLPLFNTLQYRGSSGCNTVPLLARALARGMAPQLQELIVRISRNASELELEAFADMLETL